MLRDGDKGVVLQRNGGSYAITPHLVCGLVEPAFLRKIADVADKYGAQLKCTSAQRIAIIGLKEQDVDAAWADLGTTDPGHMTGARVRSVKACPGTEFCKRARQDALAVGRILDERYHGRPMPGKMKIGVSGCGNQCAETCIKDIGLVGGARGWIVWVGGNGGTCPRLAKELNDSDVPTDRALELVDQVVAFCQQNAHPGERLGTLIARLGLPTLRRAVGLDP